MVTVPFPCNCIQMSLAAEAIQNSNTIPKRDPINYATRERSFCKLHLFTLQSATTQKSRLNYQAQAAALLLCSITSPCCTRIFNAKRVITLALCPCLLAVGCGSSAPAGPAASCRTAAPSGSALPVPLEQGFWSPSAGNSTARKQTHLRSQGAGIPSCSPSSLRSLLDVQKVSQNCSGDSTPNLGCTEAKY